MNYRVTYRAPYFCWKKIYLWLILCLPVVVSADEGLDKQRMYELIKQQQKLLEQQQQQINELRDIVLKGQKQQVQVSKKLDKTEHKVKKIARSSGKFSVSKKGLRVQSKSGDFSFRAGGRIHADYANYADDVTQMGSGAQLRRARIYFKGKLFRDWAYKAEIEFAENGKVGPRGVWLAYNGWKPVTLTLGNFQEPFSLEEMTGSNNITFMERSLINTFAPSYHIGLGAKGYGRFWSWSGGVFGDAFKNKDDNIDNGWGIASRATFAPILSAKKLFHIGFSSEYRQTDTGNRARVRTRPESHITNRRLVDTRTIKNVDHTWLFGSEIAANYGPFSLQGEYIHSQVARLQAKDLGFDGAYVQGSWFLTGESRPYKVKNGTFGAIDPLNDYGAWEFATRYSWIDLNSKDITGGQESNVTVGLNWYANYNVRFMMNYTFVQAYPNRNGINESPNIFQMRGQVMF